MIRTTAVEAIAQIADRNKRALELLLKRAHHENFSVKRAAIQGYLEHGGKGAREALDKVLSKKDQYILDIHRVKVREAPQGEGGLYLVCADGEEELPPPSLPNKGRYQQ